MMKICVVTGSRAEYGLFYPLLCRLKRERSFMPGIIASGMHLSRLCGSTYREILKDGFTIDAKVELRLEDDTEHAIASYIAAGINKFSLVFKRLKPDAVIVIGDRYETFAAAVGSFINRIPLVHLYGGELTEGAIDDALRHSITKMSVLHFVANKEYRLRVIQLGELPQKVFSVGALGIDNIKTTEFLSKTELEKAIGFKFDRPIFMVTFHPVTLDGDTSVNQFKELLAALDVFKEVNIIFTKPNFDAHNLSIRRQIDDYARSNHGRCVVYDSLGRQLYLSVLRFTTVVIGNSSSGIIEFPLFGKPTVNIGDRQKGRIKPKSVIDCTPFKKEIICAIKKTLSLNFRSKCLRLRSLYGDGRASERIVKILKRELPNIKGVKKVFYDLKHRNRGRI